MNDGMVMSLEETWRLMEEAITRMKRILEEQSQEPPFNAEQYMLLYTRVYDLCCQCTETDYPQQLYGKYEQAIVDYIDSTILPSLRDKHGESLLRELVKRWSNHKMMVRWLSHILRYIEQFLERILLPSLNEVGLTCFRDLVYQEISVKAKDAALAMIAVEREGGQIDKALLNNVFDVYAEIGADELDFYDDGREKKNSGRQASLKRHEMPFFADWRGFACYPAMMQAPGSSSSRNGRIIFPTTPFPLVPLRKNIH